MAYYKIAAHEELQKKFGDLYCAAYLLDSIQGEISKYIRSKLGIELSAKIEYICVDLDFPECLLLEIHVDNQYSMEVFEKLKDVFPGWDWRLVDCNINSKDITLVLNDDVVLTIPAFMFEE